MSSNPGSVGFSGGRTRTAIDSTVSLYSIPRIHLKLHTNFDRRLPILVRSATATTTFARHAHSTGCSWRPHHRAHRPRGNARGRPRRRAGHGSKESFVATKCNGVVKICYGRSADPGSKLVNTRAGLSLQSGCHVAETRVNRRQRLERSQDSPFPNKPRPI
jgi:hypothetical protein